MADHSLAESIGALARFLVGDATVAETLHRVAVLAVEAVEPADLVGITMLVEGRDRTAVFTDETAPEIDQAQYDVGDGPCLTAFREQRVTGIESTKEDGEWPAFRLAAADHGILSTLSLPLVVNGEGVGALNLYSPRERGFDDRHRESAALFAAQASVVLANAQVYWDARDMSRRLGEAMAHRAVIEQAKGILMAAQGCTEDEAFDLLVRASQRENLKLRSVARRIVDDAVGRGTAAAGA